MSIIIGQRNGYFVENTEAINPHILVTGITGAGKSVFCQSQLVQRAEAGERIIALNYRNVLAREQMIPQIRHRYEKLSYVVHVRSGVPLPLFTPFVSPCGEAEELKSTCHRISSLLKVAGNLTDAQTRVLNEAVKYVMHKGLYNKMGIKAIGQKLEDIGTPVAHRTLGNLRALIDTNVIVDGDFLDNEARIIELDFSGTEYDDELTIVRFVCDYCLRLAKSKKFAESPITLFLDEVQNFDFSAVSTMRSLVNEGRKMGVTLLMATPSLFTSGQANMKILNQVGTRIVFKPLNNEYKKTAEDLDNRHREYLLCELPDLKRGEFLYGVSAKDSGEARQFEVLQTYLPPLPTEEQ